jgi:hypothetical protein
VACYRVNLNFTLSVVYVKTLFWGLCNVMFYTYFAVPVQSIRLCRQIVFAVLDAQELVIGTAFEITLLIG